MTEDNNNSNQNLSHNTLSDPIRKKKYKKNNNSSNRDINSGNKVKNGENDNTESQSRGKKVFRGKRQKGSQDNRNQNMPNVNSNTPSNKYPQNKRKQRKTKYQFNKLKIAQQELLLNQNQESILLTNDELKAPMLEETLSIDGRTHTLYIKNINSKIKVWKLKELLYNLFVPYGKILDIVAYRTPIKMRGQAFVILDSILNATKALHELNGTTFIDRPLNIEFSKTKSLAIAEIDGTYNEIRHKQQAKKNSGNKRKYRGELEEELQRLKRRKVDTPTNYLLIEELPEQVGSTEGRDKFIMLLNGRDGFKDVNVKGSDLAIVQFTTTEYARNAKLALDGYTFMDKQLNVSFYSKGQIVES